MAFDSKGLDDYIDVAQRIAEFRVKHPEGSLQPLNPAQPFEIRDLAGTDKNGKEVRGTFIIYAAAAYRTPDDPRPGVGCAYEVFPGRTPYTAGSELQNAETAAWGRAIVAVLAADTRAGVASQQEVRNRQAERGQSAGDVFESAAPVPPRQADRQQPPPPSPEAIDADAQVFADEAHKATVPAQIEGIHKRAREAKKVAALIRNPSSGGVGKLAVYLDWKRKQLMAAPPSLPVLTLTTRGPPRSKNSAARTTPMTPRRLRRGRPARQRRDRRGALRSHPGCHPGPLPGRQQGREASGMNGPPG